MDFIIDNVSIEKLYINTQEFRKLYVNGILVFDSTVFDIIEYSNFTMLAADGFTQELGREYLLNTGDVTINASMHSGTLLKLTDTVTIDLPVDEDPNALFYIETSIPYQSILRTVIDPAPASWHLIPGTVITIEYDIAELRQDGGDYIHLINVSDWHGYVPNDKWAVFTKISDPTFLGINIYKGGGASDWPGINTYANDGKVKVEWSTNTNSIWINDIDTGYTPAANINVFNIRGKSGTFTDYDNWSIAASGISIYNFSVNGETYDLNSTANKNQQVITGSNGTQMELIAEAGNWQDMWKTKTGSLNKIIYFDGNLNKHVQLSSMPTTGGTVKLQNMAIGHLAVLIPGVELIQADLDLLDSDPLLLPSLVLGKIDTGLSIVTADIRNYYTMFPTLQISLSRVYDTVTGIGITINGTPTTVTSNELLVKVPYGLQTFRLDLDPDRKVLRVLDDWGIKNKPDMAFYTSSAGNAVGIIDTGINLLNGNDFAIFVSWEQGEIDDSTSSYQFLVNSGTIGYFTFYLVVNVGYTIFKIYLNNAEIFSEDITTRTNNIAAFAFHYKEVGNTIEYAFNGEPLTFLSGDFSAGLPSVGPISLSGGVQTGNSSNYPVLVRMGEVMMSSKKDQDYTTAWDSYWYRIKDLN